MTVRRVHLPPDRIGGGRARLTPEARHYLGDVLRLGPGDEVEVFDGDGGRYAGRIEAGLETVALGPREDARATRTELALLFALAKGEKVDLVVQKATELGAARIAPFAAARSVVRLDGAKGEERARRWRRIAEEAARQCGRADVPAVLAPVGLDAALAGLPAGMLPFVFHPGGTPLSQVEVAAGAAAFAAVVGPEGGLADEELEACRRAGAVPASLGPRVLRAETAAIVALALLQARFGDLS
ncbi:MAG TPA: 16S rRNA (uracil(1498)-N(3))-methyltransferase [Anaeromyxobacter sp.]|nr:16S rRNA (uracil(1498)-N(3))-methyltransferase [Anaeromyxobacter sp.]